MNRDELKEIMRELLTELLEENSNFVNPNNSVDADDLLRLDAAYDKLLHKFYKKGYIYELVMKNKIPHHKIGKHTYFSIIELEEWLQKTKPKV